MDELLTKQVPQSLEAEQSVLGSMLIDERCVPDVIALLQPDEFYLQQNRDIFETIYTMFNFSQHIDPVTVLDKMKERGVYDEAHSYDYIAQLLQITPTAANVRQYCAIVHDKALMRNLGTAADEITAMVQEGVGTAQEMLEAAEKKVYSLRKENSGDSLQHIGKVLINVYDRLEELAESGNEIPGLSTGLHDLDKKINGPSAHCGAPRHGQNVDGAERGALGREKHQQDRRVLFFGNVARTAGNAAFVQRKLCRQPEACHRQADRGGLEQALHRLVRARDGQIVCTQLLQRLRDAHGPVSVGVGLHHAQKLHAPSNVPAQLFVVFLQGVQVNNRPGPLQCRFHKLHNVRLFLFFIQ